MIQIVEADGVTVDTGDMSMSIKHIDFDRNPIHAMGRAFAFDCLPDSMSDDDLQDLKAVPDLDDSYVFRGMIISKLPQTRFFTYNRLLVVYADGGAEWLVDDEIPEHPHNN